MAEKNNKVKYGLKKCYYARATFDEEGNVSYDVPVAMPGARSLSLDAEGSNEPYYCDDTVWVVLNSNTGYTGDVEFAVLPESFYTDILHEELDSNGVMAESSEVEQEHFAFMCEFSGDVRKTRHVFYNCTCTRPTVESATTEDTKEPQTDTIEITASPLINGYVKAKTCSTTSEEVYNSWFDQVYEPQSEAETEETDGNG